MVRIKALIGLGPDQLFGLRELVRCLTAFVLVSMCLVVMGRTPVCAQILRLQGAPRYEVAPFLEVLKDSGGAWTIDQISGPALAGAFRSIGEGSINLGVTEAVYWLRFSMVVQSDRQSAAGQPLVWLFDLRWPFVKQMDVFAVSGEPVGRHKIEKVASGGSRCHFFDRVPQRGCSTVFYLSAVTGKPKTFYIRIVPLGHLALSPVITTMKDYQDGVARGMLISGLILGIFLALALYGLVMLIILREHSYGWLALSVFLLGSYFALVQPLAVDYFFDLPVEVIRRSAQLSFGGAVLFLGFFARSFVDKPPGVSEEGRTDRFLLLFRLLGGLLILLAFVGNSLVQEVAFIFLALFTFPVMIAASLMAWRQGIRRARFLFLASIVAGGCGIAEVMLHFGVLPFTPVLSHLFEFGSICGVGLLVCAQGDSLRTLQREREALRVSERRHMLLAFTDALTGLFNLRYFRIQLDLEIRRAEQLQQPFTLMMMDIDNFKLFNDCYGHLEGDRVLHHLGELIRSVIREQDVACRYGGEEFAIILPGSGHAVAIDIHARLQLALQQWAQKETMRLPHVVTLSIGVAEYAPGEVSEDIIERADSAMYSAKHSGRDRLVLSQDGKLQEDLKCRNGYATL